MIQASELRIGNWLNLLVKDEDYGSTKAALPFQIKDAQHLAKLFDISAPNDLFAPIPLTPEILEACGFKKDERQDCYAIWESESNVGIEYFSGLIHLRGFDSAEPLPVKYLHQLQNLICALTGQELTVNLPANQPA